MRPPILSKRRRRPRLAVIPASEPGSIHPRPRRRESWCDASEFSAAWIPAFAGMTGSEKKPTAYASAFPARPASTVRIAPTRFCVASACGFVKRSSGLPTSTIRPADITETRLVV